MRSIYLTLSKQYGVRMVLGVRGGLAGFEEGGPEPIELDDEMVKGIHREGEKVLQCIRA